MSSSYQVYSPRPRPPPVPVPFCPSPIRPSSVLQDSLTNSPPLLYDFPPATSQISPPTSPRLKRRLISPTSPSFSTHSLSNSPTNPRNLSATPLGVAPSQLEAFAKHCRSWYFSQNEESGRIMTHTLTTLPPSQRAPFSRLQASIRSAYHDHMNARKNAEFHAHLTTTHPGCSLSAHLRADWQGPLARKERRDRLERLVLNWCTMGMPGTVPFFEALWAIFRLQIIPEELGGAGGYRIEWELDDAVMKEAAGKDFMFDAIDVLKGVLGFEESPSLIPHEGRDCGSAIRSPLVNHGQPSLAGLEHLNQQTDITAINRMRALSDPFLDAHPLSSLLTLTSSDGSSLNPTKTTTWRASTVNLISSLTVEGGGYHAEAEAAPGRNGGFEVTEGNCRIWTCPDLSNLELVELIKLFPAFVSRRPLPRFHVGGNVGTATEQQRDVHLGGDGRKRIKFGTGMLLISNKPRVHGWNGSWWTRFVLWWRRLFC